VAESYTAVCCTQLWNMAVFGTLEFLRGSVAARLRCGGVFNIDYCKFTGESVSERILKIGQHLAKLWWAKV